jgi:hypothetical protein
VQEEADRFGDAEIAQLRTEREEVIVLHPKGGVRLAEAQQRARHEGVDFAIAEIIFPRRPDQVGARMHRRPQRGIGEAFVVTAVVRGRSRAGDAPVPSNSISANGSGSVANAAGKFSQIAPEFSTTGNDAALSRRHGLGSPCRARRDLKNDGLRSPPVKVGR